MTPKSIFEDVLLLDKTITLRLPSKGELDKLLTALRVCKSRYKKLTSNLGFDFDMKVIDATILANWGTDIDAKIHMREPIEKTISYIVLNITEPCDSQNIPQNAPEESS